MVVKTLIFKTIKDYSYIKGKLQEVINEHNSGPFSESGNIILVNNPKLHLFTSTFKEDDVRFLEVIKLFNKIDELQYLNGKIKASENNYGDIVIYFTPTKEQKQYIDQILKLEGLKKNPVALTIGTIKENFNISMEKREAGLKVLMRKVYSFFRGKKIAFDEAQSITF
uniref:Uncharacterized protein n=1 Tax=Iridovirus sp. TaxID=135728 RepID=A0AAU7YCJ3_9VIRU